MHTASATTLPQRSSDVEVVSTREIEQYARLVSERFAPLRITADNPSAFEGTIRGKRLGEIEVFDVSANQHDVDRPQPLANRTPQRTYMLHVQLSGVGIIAQHGREAELQAGDLAFYDSDHAYSLNLDDEFRNIILVFPQELLALPHPLTQQMTATRIVGTQQLTSIARTFITQLTGALGTMSETSGRRVARNAVDLVSTLIHAEMGVEAHHLRDPHRGDQLFHRICEYIEDQLGVPSLDPKQIADAHFISVRTLHALFQRKASTGVAEHIRSRRLELCRRDLESRLQDALPINAVAERYGFVSAPHFSRLFKSRFDATPAEYRRLSQARDQHEALAHPAPRR